MAITNNNYDKLYQQALKKAGWQKNPRVRTAFTIAGVITIIALVKIASLSIYALSEPTSLIGTIGYNSIGFEELIICSSLGFIISAILAVRLKRYHSLIFCLANHTHEEKGFLYTIKDEQGKIKAYLYGTVHMMPLHWKGLNQQTRNLIDSCRKVYVECQENEEIIDDLLELRRKIIARDGDFMKQLRVQSGIDFRIENYALQKEITLNSLDTHNDQEKIVEAFESFMKDPQFSLRSESVRKRIDRLIVAWQTGDEEEMQSAIFDVIGTSSEKSNREVEGLRKLFHSRNNSWMIKLSEEVQKEEDEPLFIAVGSGHLFDSKSLNITGLLTLMKRKGWIIERVAYQPNFLLSF